MIRGKHIGFLFLLLDFLFTANHGSPVLYNRTYGRYTYVLPLHNSTGQMGETAYSAQTNNFSSAQTLCATFFNGSKLATIENEAVQKNINDFIQRAKQEITLFRLTHVRVGGEMRNEWKWVNGKIFKGHETPIQQGSGSEYAALSEANPRFYEDNQTSLKFYICQHSPNYTGEFCEFNESGRCYTVNNESVSWTQARENCSKEGGDLASFDIFKDKTTLEAFAKTLSLVHVFQYWVGLLKEWFWRWSDLDYEMNYTNWRFDKTCGKGNCLALYFPNGEYEEKGKWTASNCSDSLPFICEIQSSTIAAATATTSGEVQQGECNASLPSSTTAATTATTSGEVQQGECNASLPTSTIAPSIVAAIGTIVAIALAIALIVSVKKHRTRQDQKQTKPKKSTESKTKDIEKDAIYVNSDENRVNLKVATGQKSKTTNSYEDNQHQSDIYEEVQDREGMKRNIANSAASASKAGKLLYAEVEFGQQPIN